MARSKRADVAGSIYHALNRGNGRALKFQKDENFEAFERILGEGLELYDVELFALHLMPNHWHMVLRPLVDGEM
ncbi:MAG: putative transposase, partial [Pirellulaceae bacterium]